MSGDGTAQAPGRAFVLRGKRGPGLACWLRGHRWGDQGRERLLVAIMCSRCGEAVVVRHQERNEPGSVFGSATAARAAVDMLSGAVLDQPERWQRARWLLIENPPAAVDALGRLVRVLAAWPRCADDGAVLGALDWAAGQASLELLGAELDADG